MLGTWINSIKSYLKENPQKKQVITLLLILAAIPLTVFITLKVQNLIQHAGGGSGTLSITDVHGTNIARTSDPNVYLTINLPSDWTTNPSASFKGTNIGLVEKSYAQTSCPTITCGTNSGAGGICSYGTSANSNVSGCIATCPNGKQVSGFSVSVCQSNNCYYNDCTCYPNQGECDSTTAPTAVPTPSTVSCDSTSDGSWAYSCDCNALDGTPGHHATKICSGGRTWTDPTCYSGVSVCPQSSTPSPTSASQTQGYPLPNCNPQNVICSLGQTAIRLTNGNWICSNVSTGGFANNAPSCASAFTPAPNVSVPATPAPQHILRNLYITNSDTDGSSGGSEAINITNNLNSFFNKPIPWRLNALLSGQNEASRIVQVTLYDGITFVPYVATVTLFRATQASGVISRVEVSADRYGACPSFPQVLIGKECGISALAYDSNNFPIFDGVTYQWSISSVNSIGTLGKTDGKITTFLAKNFGLGDITVTANQGGTQVQNSLQVSVTTRVLGVKTINADINRDGKVNQKDLDILLNEFDQKGLNLPADLNRDGVVNGVDYNILLKQLKTP